MADHSDIAIKRNQSWLCRSHAMRQLACSFALGKVEGLLKSVLGFLKIVAFTFFVCISNGYKDHTKTSQYSARRR